MRKLRAVTGVLRALKPIDAAGFGCALAYGVLSWSARQSGEPPLILFLAVALWAALLTFGLYAYHRRNPDEPFPLGRLIAWAILFRICGLLGGPIYEDDFYRYLWDAFRFAQDGTPYGIPPEAFFADPDVPEHFQRILDQVNYPELPTIYGPVTQLTFLLGYALSPGSILALQMEPFGHPFWVRPVEYGLIALALVYDVRRRARRGGDDCPPDRTEGR